MQGGKCSLKFNLSSTQMQHCIQEQNGGMNLSKNHSFDDEKCQ